MATCCPLSGNDDEGAEFSSHAERKAKKTHRCCECRAEIAVGQIHEVYVGKWDGEFRTYRTCLPCAEIRDHFACNTGWLFGHLWSDLRDNFFPTMTAGGPCMEGMTPAAKARLFEACLVWRAKPENRPTMDEIANQREARALAGEKQWQRLYGPPMPEPEPPKFPIRGEVLFADSEWWS